VCENCEKKVGISHSNWTILVDKRKPALPSIE
jgi:hypothetical protein